MTEIVDKKESPDPAPLTVTHAPSRRLESGEILSSEEDYDRHHAASQADGADKEEIEEGLSDG